MTALKTYTSAPQIRPIARLASGPASAMGSSTLGSGMISSIWATPPRMKSVMPWILIPFAFAMSEWASSWTRTPPKRPSATMVPRT